MGNGFKRFIDTSPLSLKSLNDQLEQLWLKVMGGIRMRDLDNTVRTVIDGKLGEEDVMSIIQQSSDEILLAVGKPGGDNLIRNGDAIFQTDGWIAQSTTVIDNAFYISVGSMVQRGIRVTGGKTYTFSLETKGTAPLQVKVGGHYAGQTSDSEGTILLNTTLPDEPFFKKHMFNIEMPSSIVSCYVSLQTYGTVSCKRIYLREGENVSNYTSNPNELDANGITISDNGVNITANRFKLDIKDEDGRIKTVLDADGAGFTNLTATSINIGERDYYSQEDTIDIYVNGISGNDKFAGDSTYYPLRTIGKALKKIPLHIRGTCNLHLSGGTYMESIFLNYGGTGKLNIMGEGGEIHGGISISATNYNITISSLKIYTRSTYCIYGIGHNNFLTMVSCLMDANGKSGTRGMYLTDGFRAYIRHCEINNCTQGIFATRGAFLDIYDCKGNINTFSIIANDMAVVNVEGTVPYGSTITQELAGGRIDGNLMAGVVGTDYTSPRDAIKTAEYIPTAKFTYNNGKYISGKVLQGMGNRGMFAFNRTAIANQLAGKVIKSVRLIVRRRNDDSLTHQATIRMFAHNNATSGSGFGYVEEYGELGTINRGEEVAILLPNTFISRLQLGTATGLMFHSTAFTKDYHFELDMAYNSRLEVLYV